MNLRKDSSQVVVDMHKSYSNTISLQIDTWGKLLEDMREYMEDMDLEKEMQLEKQS